MVMLALTIARARSRLDIRRYPGRAPLGTNSNQQLRAVFGPWLDHIVSGLEGLLCGHLLVELLTVRSQVLEFGHGFSISLA